MKKIILLFMALILTVLISIPKVFAFEPMIEGIGGFNLYPIQDMMIGTPSFTIDYDDPKEVIIELDLRNATYNSTVRNIVISGIDYYSMMLGIITNPNDVYMVNVEYITSLDDSPNPYIYNESSSMWYFSYHDYLQFSSFFFGYLKPGVTNVYTKIIITLNSLLNDLILQTLPDITPVLDKIFVFRSTYNDSWGLYVTQEMFFDWLLSVADEYAFISGKEIGFNEGNTAGYNDAKENYGKFYNGEWITANTWGTIEYNRGINNDFDYFEWMYVALSFPALVLNIEIWPGFKLGYFVLLTVIFGLISWVISLGRRGL